MTPALKYSIIGALLIVVSVVAYFVLRKKPNAKGVVTFDEPMQLLSYTVGSDSRSGTADSAGFHHVNTLCYGLGITRDEFNTHNARIASLDSILAGIVIYYPKKK